MVRRIFKTWKAWRKRHDWENNLNEELNAHVELRSADLMRSGVPKADALRRARVELGSRERYKDEARAAVGLQWLDDAWQDIAYAVRTLRRSPGFAATAI